MSNWAARMHRRAATLGNVVICGHPPSGPYPHRLEKVKFGISLDEVCKNDIPGPLLVLILRLNKEAPIRKDVFRAPGNQTAIKQLIHFLQAGRLVNVDNYSVYTIASVLKKFLRKLPGGVFGHEGELELFTIVDCPSEEEQQTRIHRLLVSLPIHTQRLLVLLFGTFRVIASNAERADTGMTSEALGVSVAPSFFHTCVSDGKTARMEDVLKFKVATKIMKQIIENFATYDLFGRENYEYYARVTGRVLRVQDEWFFSFRYPPPPRGKSAQQNYALQLSLQTEKTWLQCECDRWGLIQEESQSTPALLTAGGTTVGSSAISLGIIPEQSLLESCARLSVSLEGPGIFSVSNQSSCSSSLSTRSSHSGSHHMTMDELRAVNRYAESTKSLSFLPQVHERQTARMRTRSEWFLGGEGGGVGGSLDLQTAADAAGHPHCHFLPHFISTDEIDHMHHPAFKVCRSSMFEPTAIQHLHHHHQNAASAGGGGGGSAGGGRTTMAPFPPSNIFAGNIGLSASAESVNQMKRGNSRRSNSSSQANEKSSSSSTSRNHPHRSSSRRNKENGSRSGSFRHHHHHHHGGNHHHLHSIFNHRNLSNQNQHQNGVKTGDRRNSKHGNELEGKGGGGVGVGGVLEDTEMRTQKKQRIVSFEQTSPKWLSQADSSENTMEDLLVNSTTALVCDMMDTTPPAEDQNQSPLTSSSSSPLITASSSHKPPRV